MSLTFVVSTVEESGFGSKQELLITSSCLNLVSLISFCRKSWACTGPIPEEHFFLDPDSTSPYFGHLDFGCDCTNLVRSSIALGVMFSCST